MIKYWLLQYRQPRYMLAGVLHILLFAGFVILFLRTAETMFIGIFPGFRWPLMDTFIGTAYDVLRSYASTWVLVVAVISMIRRGIFQPARYAVPAKYGKAHTSEAVFVLAMISVLMLSESLFEGSLVAAQLQLGLPAHSLAPLTLSWAWQHLLAGASKDTLQWMHLFSYFLHDVTVFTFLCFLPLGKHFHVVTSVFNVFFMRLRRGNIKPVRYDVSEKQLDDLESIGVKKLEDFTRSTCWIFTPVPTAAAVRTTARPIPSAGPCLRALFPSKGATCCSSAIRCSVRPRATVRPAEPKHHL